MADIVQGFRLKPFQTPNFAVIDLPPVLRQEGATALPSIPIKDLDHEALCDLADQWLRETFAKANRPCPFTRDQSA